ncbi:hypothetical protein DVR12_16640 [Chitinophaga silvatica]|uniref:Uncharacterized protein n=1 Tax=Chitinophaga silvatica TaxID=2282649 RepID=A0A3E1Y7Y1_9BACT|nr:hypothetical protein [Chitinophaga silvatica]RFS20978.1 hypothetical protein DVR12_16640 [Chitinophaga silvatica]
MKIIVFFICIYIALFIFSSCNNRSITDTKSVQSDTVKIAQSSNLDEFRIDNIQFYIQHKTLDAGNINAESHCEEGYHKLNGYELRDFLSMLNFQSSYLNYQGDITEKLNDSIFATGLLKRILRDSDSSFFQVENLNFIGLKKAEITNYGICKILLFKYLTPASATQSTPVLIINQQRKEIVYLEFDDFTIRNKTIILDLKVRNDNHTLFTIEYDSKIECFVPKCYKNIKS